MSRHSDFEIRELDKSLADDGEWIEIWRLTGTQLIPVKVRCRAKVNNLGAQDLISGIKQDTSEVILSPTEIIRAGWPGPETRPVTKASTTIDRRVPQTGDKAYIKGKPRQVDVGLPTYVDDELVRIKLRVLG